MIGMRIAEEIQLPACDRSDLFYALLLKDVGCSANAERMAALFGADDREAKRTSKLIGSCASRRPSRSSTRPAASRPCGRPRGAGAAAGSTRRSWMRCSRAATTTGSGTRWMNPKCRGGSRPSWLLTADDERLDRIAEDSPA